MRKPLAAAAAAALAVGLGIAAAPSATAVPVEPGPYCGIYWGSLRESAGTYSSAQVTNVRTGRHTCFDRLVVDLNHRIKGYDVRYASSHRVGSGQYVPLAGAGDLRIVVKSPAYNSAGQATYAPANWRYAKNVNGYQTFRQVAFMGSHEGQTEFGLGVRARLPFRVFTLDGPGNGSRLVVDVAHYW